MADPLIQGLFERMADAHGEEAPLELLRWSGRLAVVRAPGPPERRFRLWAAGPYFPSGSSSVEPMAGLLVLRRRGPSGRWYAEGPVLYVSPVPSAVLAAGLR